MHALVDNPRFLSINRGYNAVFCPGRLNLGLLASLESHAVRSLPCMDRHLERVQLAEKPGLSAVWLGEVPLRMPSSGDTGQTFDHFVYLGLLAGCTERIALGNADTLCQPPGQMFVCPQGGDPSVMLGGYHVALLHQCNGAGIAGQAVEIGTEMAGKTFQLVQGIRRLERLGVQLDGSVGGVDAGAATVALLARGAVRRGIGTEEKFGIARGRRCP